MPEQGNKDIPYSKKYERNGITMPRTKIDQAFLDKVAEQHNKDYPKEYWENGGRMPEHTISKKQIITEVKALKREVRRIRISGNIYQRSLMDESWNDAIEKVLDILREY